MIEPNARTHPTAQEAPSWYGEEKSDERTPLLSEGRVRTLRPHTRCSRRTWRTLIVAVLLVTMCLWAWRWFAAPYGADDEVHTTQSDDEVSVAKKHRFSGTRLANLPPQYIPGGLEDPKGKRRLVFVGDVHGCVDELKDLLREVKFDESLDHLVTVGDVISKGPDSAGVVDELLRLNASGVRGNHEDRILAIAPSLLNDIDSSDIDIMKKGSAKDRQLLKHLKPAHIAYLDRMPLILRVPALPQAVHATSKSSSAIAEDILIVHAGLVPAVSLEKQKPYFVMNMRSIKKKNHLPLAEAARKKDKSEPWHEVWGWYNDRLFRKKSVKDFEEEGQGGEEFESPEDSLLGPLGLVKPSKWPKPQVVVYGHHSREGLQLSRWSKGLDTGCVRGGKLTAMVLDASGEWKVKHVKCKDHR